MRGIILCIKTPIVIYATYWEHTKKWRVSLFYFTKIERKI